MNELERLNEFTKRYQELCKDLNFHFECGFDSGAIAEGAGDNFGLFTFNAYINGERLEFDDNANEWSDC